MATWPFAPFILAIFFARDFCLLRMGSPSKLAIRVLVYALVLLATMAVFAILPASADKENSSSDHFVLPYVYFYAALCLLGIWLRKTDRHKVAWLIAVVPNPLLAAVLSAFLPAPYPAVGALVLAGLWIVLMILSLRYFGRRVLDVPDLDYALTFTALLNSAALLMLVL